MAHGLFESDLSISNVFHISVRCRTFMRLVVSLKTEFRRKDDGRKPVELREKMELLTGVTQESVVGISTLVMRLKNNILKIL